MDHTLQIEEIPNETRERLDKIAGEFLQGVRSKKEYPIYKGIQYRETETGDFLFVCEDESMLYTPSSIGKTLNLMAFCNGFRTDVGALKNRRIGRSWENSLGG